MSLPSYPKVTLVGAGPGDPDLISVKASGLAKCRCRVVRCPGKRRTLALCPEEAPRIYVAATGAARITQTKINELIVLMANMHGHVVRLKGGDPFVFGRDRKKSLSPPTRPGNGDCTGHIQQHCRT